MRASSASPASQSASATPTAPAVTPILEVVGMRYSCSVRTAVQAAHPVIAPRAARYARRPLTLRRRGSISVRAAVAPASATPFSTAWGSFRRAKNSPSTSGIPRSYVTTAAGSVLELAGCAGCAGFSLWGPSGIPGRAEYEVTKVIHRFSGGLSRVRPSWVGSANRGGE